MNPCGSGYASSCDKTEKPLVRTSKRLSSAEPLGMPLIRKLATGLWEVRSHVSTGIARVIFTVDGQTMVLLHGFQKKSQRTPPADLMTAKRRLAQLQSE